MLRCTQPNPLWSTVGHLLGDPDSSLRHIVSAMGYQHLAIDSGRPASPKVELTLTTQAIRALRDSITNSTGVSAVEHMVAAVFFTVLESLRGSCAQTMVHLEHGIRLGREKHSSNTEMQVQDCLRVLDDHARNVILLEPNAGAREKGRELLIGSLTDYSMVDGVKSDNDSSLMTAVHLLESTALAIGHQYSESRQIPVSEIRDYFVSLWAQMHTQVVKLEVAVDKVLNDPGILADKPRLIQFHMAKAKCLMLTPWTTKDYAYSLSDFDQDLPLYVSALDHIEAAMDLYGSTQGKQGDTRPPAFSLGLGQHRSILAIVAYCRDPALRRRAISLLDKCPIMEGPWKTTTTRAMGKTLIAFEEERAAKITGRTPQTAADIPDECRVVIHHPISIRGQDQHAPPTMGLRVYFRNKDNPDEMLSERLEKLEV